MSDGGPKAPDSDPTASDPTASDPAGDAVQEIKPADEPVSKPPKLLVNVADLRRRLGQRRVEPIDLELFRQTVVGSRTTDKRVTGEVTIESIERGVSVVGSINFAWEGDCRRCLEVTGGELDVDIAEYFQIGATDGSELLAFDGDQIDLVPLVHDAVVLSLPLAPLCGDDCAGPDPDRYPALTTEQSEQQKAEEAAAAPDPRWAALDQLKLDDN